MDAIAHCIETYLAPAFNPPAEGIALDGLERGLKWIERAVIDGHDREARRQMMSASMQGAMAFQKGLGAVHSLSHALGSFKPKTLHHGTLNAVVLTGGAALQSIRGNGGGTGQICALAARNGSDKGVAIDRTIEVLNARIGLPNGLEAMGVPRSFFDEAVDKALKDHCHATNPRLATAAEYREMPAQSYLSGTIACANPRSADAAYAVFSAASTFSGVNGTERSRAPVASKIALAMAEGTTAAVGSRRPTASRSGGR